LRTPNSYDLSVRFDTTVETRIKIYWGAKERVLQKDEGVSYEFVDLKGQFVEPWTFGPFPAGMDQLFVVPDSHKIDIDLLNRINMGWVSELDLAKSPVLLDGSELPRPLNSIVTENVPIASVAVNVDEPKKVDKRNPGDLYKLIIVIESTNNTLKSGGIISCLDLDSQINFTHFSSSTQGQLQIQFVKQILIQNGVSLLLQEIFGFSEAQSLISSASNSTFTRSNV
jgi:hypothetical protein